MFDKKYWLVQGISDGRLTMKQLEDYKEGKISEYELNEIMRKDAPKDFKLEDVLKRND